MGYKQYGRRCGKRVLDSVRREAERADALGALVVAQSVAGGTGSGLGTAITELLQDE
jgi:tubulin delta